MQLVKSEVGIYFQMTNQLSTRSSIIKKIHLLPEFKAVTSSVHIGHTETSSLDVFGYEKRNLFCLTGL